MFSRYLFERWMRNWWGITNHEPFLGEDLWVTPSVFFYYFLLDVEFFLSQNYNQYFWMILFSLARRRRKFLLFPNIFSHFPMFLERFPWFITEKIPHEKKYSTWRPFFRSLDVEFLFFFHMWMWKKTLLSWEWVYVRCNHLQRRNHPGNLQCDG